MIYLVAHVCMDGTGDNKINISAKHGNWQTCCFGDTLAEWARIYKFKLLLMQHKDVNGTA